MQYQMTSDSYGQYSLSKEELIKSVQAAINELNRQSNKAQEFLNKIQTDSLLPGDEYLNFDQVLAEGYDRVGPSYSSFMLEGSPDTNDNDTINKIAESVDNWDDALIEEIRGEVIKDGEEF